MWSDLDAGCVAPVNFELCGGNFTNKFWLVFGENWGIIFIPEKQEGEIKQILGVSKMEENSFDEAEAILERLNQIPIEKELRPETDSIGPYLSVHIRPVTQAILCRVRELALSAICLYRQNKVVSSAILTRAIFETVALHFHLLATLVEALQKNDVQIALTELKRAGLGKFAGGTADKGIDAISIKEFAKELLQIEPKMRGYYEELSEIVHPNAMGTLLAYAKGDNKNLSFLFKEDFNHIALQAGGIILFALKFYEVNYEQMESKIPELIKLLEKL